MAAESFPCFQPPHKGDLGLPTDQKLHVPDHQHFKELYYGNIYFCEEGICGLFLALCPPPCITIPSSKIRPYMESINFAWLILPPYRFPPVCHENINFTWPILLPLKGSTIEKVVPQSARLSAWGGGQNACQDGLGHL